MNEENIKRMEILKANVLREIKLGAWLDVEEDIRGKFAFKSTGGPLTKEYIQEVLAKHLLRIKCKTNITILEGMQRAMPELGWEEEIIFYKDILILETI